MTVGSGATGTMVNQLYLSLETCLKVWLCLYLSVCVFLGLLSPMLHVTVIGLLLCVISYFRLAPPDPADAFKILGCDPRNLDGTPSKTRGALGLIAHRAAGLDAPENSLEALRLCKRNGAKCVEFDVSITADGQAVVFHDDEVSRVTNGHGLVANLTYSQLKKLDIAAKHPLKDKYSPCRIPTLEEYVQECLKLDLKMIIDLKTVGTVEKTMEMITDLYRRHPKLYGSAMSSSFYPELIYAIRLRDPKIVCSMAWRPWYVAYKGYSIIAKEMVRRFDSPFKHHLAVVGDVAFSWGYHNFFWYFLGLSAVLVHKDVLTPHYVQGWRERGIRVIAWTVNNSFQRLYVERALHVTALSDSMDELGLKDLINEERQPNTK